MKSQTCHVSVGLDLIPASCACQNRKNIGFLRGVGVQPPTLLRHGPGTSIGPNHVMGLAGSLLKSGGLLIVVVVKSHL